MSGDDQETPAYAVHHDGWGELVMNRPHRKNALTPDMLIAMRESLAELIESGANAILLRGEGGTFCSGLDVYVYSQGVPKGASETLRALHIDLFNCPALIVGALERYAVNGGAAFALAADLLIVGESAELRVGEIMQGAAAPMNVAWLMARSNEAIAMRVAGVGEPLRGPELAELGIATRVVPDSHVLSAAVELTASTGRYPNAAAKAIKATIRANSLVGDPDAWFGAASTAAGFRADWKPKRVD